MPDQLPHYHTAPPHAVRENRNGVVGESLRVRMFVGGQDIGCVRDYERLLFSGAKTTLVSSCGTRFLGGSVKSTRPSSFIFLNRDFV